MGAISEQEDQWQAKATAAAIAEARRVVNESGPLMNTPVGRLSDKQWGWIVAASLFGWITTRCEQAVAEGINREDAVRMLELDTSPGDVAVIHSILSPLADRVKIDWARPLADWSKTEMTDFLLQAWLLANDAEAVLADGAILRKKTAGGDDECQHGMPRALCRQCPDGKDDRPDNGIPF
jgi:hypothetical protein